MQLELGLAQEEVQDLLAAAAFTNQIPKPPAKSMFESICTYNGGFMTHPFISFFRCN